MILGASYSQIPLYETASRLGICDSSCEHSRRLARDLLWQMNVPTQISPTRRQFWQQPESMRSTGSQPAVWMPGIRSVGYVCENMGLKGLSANAGKLCSDKYLMKEAFLKGGVTCARHICIHNRAELEEAVKVLNFPG